MKYIKQFAVILTVSFIGEVLHEILPLPVPASIYGLVLMLAALKTGVIPLDSVRETGKFLIEIMPLMFIPAAVGLTESWDRISPIVVPLLAVTAISTVTVMVSAGRITQAVQRADQKKRGREK